MLIPDRWVWSGLKIQADSDAVERAAKMDSPALFQVHAVENLMSVPGDQNVTLHIDEVNLLVKPGKLWL